MVGLLSLTSLDKLLFKFKILFTLFTNLANLMRRSTVLSLAPQLVYDSFTRKYNFALTRAFLKEDIILE
jgi:hypothetical protein